MKENRNKVLETIIITRINNKKRKGLLIKSFHYEDGLFFDNDNLELCLSFLKQYLIDFFNEEYTEKDWKKLDGWNWSCLLREQPKFAKYCDWKKFNGYNWSCLLREQPKFAKYCDWKKLDGCDWSCLLRERPKFAKYCDWKKLNREAK